jgi:hypothetical protein
MPERWLPMLPKECRHLKTDGRKCHAIALRGEYYCHFHHPRRLRAVRATKERCFLELPLLDDGASIQAAISEIMRAIAAREIDVKLAGRMLYALQLILSKKTGASSVTQASPRCLKIAPVPGLTRLYCTKSSPETTITVAATPTAADICPKALHLQ